MKQESISVQAENRCVPLYTAASDLKAVSYTHLDVYKRQLSDIPSGTRIIKYGVPIGAATEDISKGSWVHLHVMKSLYDERSSHLDVKTGAPMDTRYE